MKFLSKIRYINKQASKKLSKYARPLLVGLTIFAVLLSMALTNISQFSFNRADSMNNEMVAGLEGANGVWKIMSAKNTDRFFTFFNYWDDSNVAVSTHADSSDYNQWADFYTDVNESWISNHPESIDVSNNGDLIVIGNTDDFNLRVYYLYEDFGYVYLDWYDTYSIPVDPFGSDYMYVRYDDNTGDIFIVTNSQITKFPSGDYENPLTYSLYNYYPTAVEIDEESGYIYIIADDYLNGYLMSNPFSGTQYDLLNDNSGGNSYIQISNSSIFVHSTSSAAIYEYSTPSVFLQEVYDLSGNSYDYEFAVGDDYIYAFGWDYVTAWKRSQPDTIIDSGTVFDSGFTSITATGNTAFALGIWYRQVFQFDVQGGGEGCPDESPPYVINPPKCERYIFDDWYEVNDQDYDGYPMDSAYNDAQGYLAVLMSPSFDYEGGSININGSVYALDYDTNDFALMQWYSSSPNGIMIAPDGSGIYVPLYNLSGPHAHMLYMEYPSGVTNIYEVDVGNTNYQYLDYYAINVDGDIFAYSSDNLYIIPGGDFGNIQYKYTGYGFIDGFAVNDYGDVFMSNGNQYIDIFWGANYNNNDFMYLGGDWDYVNEVITLSLPGNKYNLYAIVKDNSGHPYLISFLNCQAGSSLGSCSEGDTVELPYGVMGMFDVDRVFIDADGNVFFIGGSGNVVGRVLQGNGNIQLFELQNISQPIVSVALTDLQDLFITSQDYIYEYYYYEFVPYEGGGGTGDGPVQIVGDAGLGNLEGSWRMDYDYYDSSGNGHEWSPNGSIIFSDQSPFGYGGIAELNGGYLDMGTVETGFNGNSAFTISAWVRPFDMNTDGCILSYGEADLNKVLSLCATDSNNVYVVHYGNDYTYSATYNMGQWQHVVLTYNPNTDLQKLYMNGQFLEQASIDDLDLSPMGVLQIGRAVWNGVVMDDMDVDEVRLYSRELSLEEIQGLYGNNLPKVPTNTDVDFIGSVINLDPFEYEDSPTGDVEVWVDGNFSSSVSLTGNEDYGKFEIPVQFGASGIYAITIKYAGDTNFAPAEFELGDLEVYGGVTGTGTKVTDLPYDISRRIDVLPDYTIATYGDEHFFSPNSEYTMHIDPNDYEYIINGDSGFGKEWIADNLNSVSISNDQWLFYVYGPEATLRIIDFNGNSGWDYYYSPPGLGPTTYLNTAYHNNYERLYVATDDKLTVFSNVHTGNPDDIVIDQYDYPENFIDWSTDVIVDETYNFVYVLGNNGGIIRFDIGGDMNNPDTYDIYWSGAICPKQIELSPDSTRAYVSDSCILNTVWEYNLEWPIFDFIRTYEQISYPEDTMTDFVVSEDYIYVSIYNTVIRYEIGGDEELTGIIATPIEEDVDFVDIDYVFRNGKDHIYALDGDPSIYEFVFEGLGGTELSETHLLSVTPSTKVVSGESMTFNVEVIDPNNPSVFPTGYVEIRLPICCGSDYDVLGYAPLDEFGQGSLTSWLNPGNWTVYGYYVGDSTYAHSQSITMSLEVYSIQTFTTLETSQNPVLKGNSITLTAHVTLPNYTIPMDSSAEMEGWVRFRIGTNEIGYALVDENGYASITVNTSDSPIGYLNLDEGVHHIRAHFYPWWDGINYQLRQSSSETLFQAVIESGAGDDPTSGGGDIPPEGGEGGNSDFAATIKGKDKVTGSVTQTKIGSILDWTMDYNNLGPNSNGAVTYFPIRENQEFVVGSVDAPINWDITYSQDQTCDEATFTYTPVGADGSTDPTVRCVRFENERVNVPPTRSNIRYITTAADFTELNVQALGGIDVFKVVPYNNKLFYFNHHWLVSRTEPIPTKTMFCFDLEINDTCVSNNPNTVYPVVLGLDARDDIDDEFLSSKTAYAVNAEVAHDKIYIPMTDVNTSDGVGNGHGFLCWDLIQDYYCTSSGFARGFVSLNSEIINAWGWGNIGDIEYNPDLDEVYTVSVGPNDLHMVLLCFSIVLDAPCPGQPYEIGNFQGFDPGYGFVKYHQSAGRIYTVSGGNVGSLDRQIQCTIAATKTRCPDFPEEGVQVLPEHRNQKIFINANNDQMCAYLPSDGMDTPDSPAIYCYDQDAETFYNYMPNMAGTHFASDMFHDLGDGYPGRLFYMARWTDAVIMCWDIETGDQCEGWEDGISTDTPPFDWQIYTFNYAFGCMWAASDSGRVFTFDPIDGGSCNPLITLTQGNVAVTLDANNMFCASDPDDITWNKVKVLDSGTSPSPAILNAAVYDSSQCTTSESNVITCSGAPLKSGNLLLNSGHELDISDISYADHRSLTALLQFQYPAVPSPAPGFYIELNPTNKAQMCASTKLVFSGALCANPITTVCENTNISYVNDPVSNNNSDQYCLNVETYFGKDPNSALCFVATTPDENVFTVFNPDATVAPPGTSVPFNPEETYNRGDGTYSFGNGFFGFIEGFIEQNIPQIVTEEVIRETLSSIDTSTPLAVTAVTAVTTATVVATSVFAAGSGFGQVIGVFLGFLTPRKRKYWGIVVDDLTNKPIAFASITLSVKEIGSDNELKSTVIAQAVSDLDGRYRLNTDRRDQFYLEVKASGYQPFTKFITMVNPLSSAEDIVYDVPLRRLDAKPNVLSRLLNYRKTNLIGFARAVLLVMSVLGFVFTIYSQINFPNNLNWILLVVYILVFAISFYPSIYSRIQKRGKVVDIDANSPLPGAVVRIYDAKQQIALSLTNSNGEARFDLAEGEYSILASKRGYLMVAEEGKTLIKAVVKREGYLDRNILMRRSAEAPSESAATGGMLENPFA